MFYKTRYCDIFPIVKKSLDLGNEELNKKFIHNLPGVEYSIRMNCTDVPCGLPCNLYKENRYTIIALIPNKEEPVNKTIVELEDIGEFKDAEEKLKEMQSTIC